jgi:hypothetical protein
VAIKATQLQGRAGKSCRRLAVAAGPALAAGGGTCAKALIGKQ